MIKAVIFDMYETLITLFGSPFYFVRQMASDADVEEEKFREIWRAAETDRAIGKMTLEEVLDKILKTNNCYSEAKRDLIVSKRIRNREEVFGHLHKDIIPMLRGLKEKGLRIGLISNCFLEEATVIKKSILYPYFDAVCLSCDERVKKPDLAIYKKCLEKLNVQAGDCLYVGDGGSDELETAQMAGMAAGQAVWYLKEGKDWPSKRKTAFPQLETPLDVLAILSAP